MLFVLLATLQIILARDGKTPLFECQPPGHFQAIHPSQENLNDTKIPLMEWQTDGVKITLHTFPIHNTRPGPEQQILRWKGQLAPLTSEKITPKNFAGFEGLLFVGSNKTRSVIAYTMHLASSHIYKLSSRPHMLVDFTVKATGDTEKVKKAHDAIVTFAETIEFVEDI